MEALIVSGGHLKDAFILSYMQEHKCGLVIAVDSGMSFFYRTGWTPDYIVGDFDSAAPWVLQSFTDLKGAEEKKRPVILQFQPEKDETDTELAIRTAMEQGYSRIHLLGATGSRIDHVMGNIHLLGMAMQRNVECLMADENNRIRMIRQGIVIQKKEQYGDYISLFPFTPQVTGLTLTGFKYPLDGYTLECYHSLGVSNEIIGEQAEISFKEGVLLMIESKD